MRASFHLSWTLWSHLKVFSQDRNWNSSSLPHSCLFLNLLKLFFQPVGYFLPQ